MGDEAGAPAGALTAEQLGELREAFALFDKNGDGTISKDELAAVLVSLGEAAEPDDVQMMLESVDANADGVIDFDEFVALMQVHFYEDGPSEAEELRQAFRVFDRNGDGFIEPEELRSAFLNLGERLSDGQLEEMIRAADKDGNGKIDYEEFIDMMRTH